MAGSSFKFANDRYLDSSGVVVNDKGKTLKEAIEDGSIGGSGIEITYAEWLALPEEERNSGTYYITDGKEGSQGGETTHLVRGILEAGQTELVLSDPSISNNCVIDPYVDEQHYGEVFPSAIRTEDGKCTITFDDAFDDDIELGIRIFKL